MRHGVSVVILAAALWAFVSADKPLKRNFEFPNTLRQALNQAAKSRNKRAAFAAAMAPALAESAGDVLRNVGNKLVEGATAVLTAGSKHVEEATKKADDHAKEAETGAKDAQAKSTGYDQATLSLMPSKGELGFGETMSMEPPGFAVSEKLGKKDKEPEEKKSESFMPYPMGVGMAMMNGCFGSGYGEGDPCYWTAHDITTSLCLTMLDAAAFIGVGFDGRGDYSSDYRKKSIVQRLCANKGSFQDAQVPDTMNVHGVYDTEVEQTVFSSSGQFQQYLEEKAATSSYKSSFSEAMRKTYGTVASIKSGGLGGLAAGEIGPQVSVTTSGSTANKKSKQTGTQAASEASGQTSKETQSTFMSMLEVNIIRFEIFMDEVKPTDLSQAFLADFLALPKSYFNTRAPLKYQSFILRWGTHFIKSAKFGGHLRLTRTKTYSGSASVQQFSESSNSDTQSLFSNSYSTHRGQFKAGASVSLSDGVKAEASYNSDDKFNSNSEANGNSDSNSGRQSTASKETTSYGNEYMLVEGGSQTIAAIVTDFYAPTFKDAFESWLESVPDYPKPFEFKMGTTADLLDMNVMEMFTDQNATIGCQNAKEYSTERHQFYYSVNVTNQDNTTSQVVRYCEHGRNANELQAAIDMRRRSLKRAITVYMEEGPIPAYDLNIQGGDPGCETQNKKSVSGNTALSPTWLDLISGSFFKMVFDMPLDVPDIALKRDILHVSFLDNTWYNKLPEARLHLFNGFTNGGASVTSNKKVSINGLVMTYDESTGLFTVTGSDFQTSNATLQTLPLWLSGSTVARAEFLQPIDHVKSQGNSGFSINPCSLKFYNSHKFHPDLPGGRCVKFTAATEGDVFVVFAAIPNDHNTWYHVQITPTGVAFYKGMQIVTRDHSLQARGLGDGGLYQSYFVCVEEKSNQVTINYGIAKENQAMGVIYVSWTDTVKPLQVQYYAFGAGEKELNIMDIHVIPTKDMGVLTCGAKEVEGRCELECHAECNGCSMKKSDKACTACKNYNLKVQNETRCVSTCPDGYYVSADGKSCVCNLAHVNTRNDCLSRCPTGTHKSGRLCKITQECKTTVMGREYIGIISVSRDGTACKRWTTINAFRPKPELFPDETVADAANYCRNPDSTANGPWCYPVTGGWSYCNISSCSADINRCATQPCQNGGVCVNRPDSYTCACTSNFSGTNCATDINQCRHNPCKQGSTCSNSGATYTCNCTAGYEGTNCDIDTDDCAGKTCMFGGSCVDRVNGFHCLCPQTHTYGKYCNLDNGVYKIVNRGGCPGGKWCNAMLAWDGRVSKHPLVTLEFDEFVLWSLETTGDSKYHIKSKYGCPSNAWCDADMSWDAPPTGSSGTPTISVKQDPVQWHIKPSNRYWRIFNTYACNSQGVGKYCKTWYISYDGRSGTYPLAKLQNNDPVDWEFVKVS